MRLLFCLEGNVPFNHGGKGYATKSVAASLKYEFETLNLTEIVSFTRLANKRSRHVIEKVGMHRNPEDDFNFPKEARDSSAKTCPSPF